MICNGDYILSFIQNTIIATVVVDHLFIVFAVSKDEPHIKRKKKSCVPLNQEQTALLHVIIMIMMCCVHLPPTLAV